MSVREDAVMQHDCRSSIHMLAAFLLGSILFLLMKLVRSCAVICTSAQSLNNSNCPCLASLKPLLIICCKTNY
eukprot:4078143-Ditylum_brightwellii.AAC.1